VIADHLRSTSFLLADGVLPSNEGRGYVLRRIMRRAMRHAHLLGAKEPLMHRLVPALVAEMGQAYPELGRAQPLIEETLQREEIQFRRTLSNGLKLLDEATAGLGAGDSLPGETAFRLYDTFGFPYDLTEDALARAGYRCGSREGFDAAMAQQKAAARAAWKGSGKRRTAKSGSISPNAKARPNSPATPPPPARAGRRAGQGRRRSRLGRGRRRCGGPDQPDAVLWRKRRPERRCRGDCGRRWADADSGRYRQAAGPASRPSGESRGGHGSGVGDTVI
jgi:hypothetical protein